MSDCPLPSGAVSRDAWREIRNQIQDNEQQLLELQFDYKQRVNVVEALKLELRQVTQDTHECEETARKCSHEAYSGYRKLQELEQHLRGLEQDQVLLASQLAGEQRDVAALQDKLTSTKASFAEHLAAQQSHLHKLQNMLEAAGGTAAAFEASAEQAAADVLMTAL